MVQKNAIFDALGRKRLLKNTSQTQTGTRWGWALWVVLDKMIGKVRRRTQVYSVEPGRKKSRRAARSQWGVQISSKSTQHKQEPKENLEGETGWSPFEALGSGHSLHFWENSCIAVQKIQKGAGIITRSVEPVSALHSVKPISCTSTFCTEMGLPLLRWEKNRVNSPQEVRGHQ